MAGTSRGSRSAGSRSRPTSGTRYGASTGGGGGGRANNAVAVVIAVGVLVVVVAAFVFLKKKDKAPEPPPAVDTPVIAPPTGPVKPAPPRKAPLPQLPAELVSRAKALLPELKDANVKGTALFNEALKAKDANDADTWQLKMEQAREIMKGARDKWVLIEEEVQLIVDRAGKLEGWTDASAHEGLFDMYLKEESRLERSLIDEPLSRMSKSGRSR